MSIEIDLTSLWQNFLIFSSQDPITMAWQIFLNGGWVFVLILIIYSLYQAWLGGRKKKFASKWNFSLLAIDIPKYNEQTPKAVENVFTALAATQSSGNLIDRYWEGKVQESFSFEVVSLEGYVQFLVRTPSHFRDLIEAAIYAQYPEAEITEVEDYVEAYKEIKFPNEDYNIWGTDFVLVKDYPYPIKTYPEFEHSLSQTFIDPMAGLLEVMSNLDPGEQLWLQLVVEPVKPDWGEAAKKITKELKGEQYAAPESKSQQFLKPIQSLTNFAGEIVQEAFGIGLGSDGSKKEDDQWKMFKLSPRERMVFEKVQNKLSKIPFKTKFRMVYFGRKDGFNKAKGVAAVIGAIQQFNLMDSNGFKPGAKTKTGVDYFFVQKRTAERQNKILKFYADRTIKGDDPYLMSTEELASLWHFPNIGVKAPSIERVGARRAVPPSRLPYEKRQIPTKKSSKPDQQAAIESLDSLPSTSKDLSSNKEDEKKSKSPFKAGPPPNLPTV